MRATERDSDRAGDGLVAADQGALERLVGGPLRACEVCLEGRRGDLRLPTMNQLVYFIQVATTASFAAAARDFALSTDTIRHAMNELEQLVGLPLVVRSPRRVGLAPAGRLVLPLAHRIVYLATVIGSIGERPVNGHHVEVAAQADLERR